MHAICVAHTFEVPVMPPIELQCTYHSLSTEITFFSVIYLILILYFVSEHEELIAFQIAEVLQSSIESRGLEIVESMSLSSAIMSLLFPQLIMVSLDLSCTFGSISLKNLYRDKDHLQKLIVAKYDQKKCAEFFM